MINGKFWNQWVSLWNRVDKTATCWNWTGLVSGPTRWQYGSMCWPPLKDSRPHRIVYTLLFGAIPSGKIILHKCDNRLCVRPDHLAIGTQLDNMRDAKAKRRDAWSKMTHCKHGHPFDGDNVRLDRRDGYIVRRCQACHRRNAAKYRRKIAAGDAEDKF